MTGDAHQEEAIIQKIGCPPTPHSSDTDSDISDKCWSCASHKCRSFQIYFLFIDFKVLKRRPTYLWSCCQIRVDWGFIWNKKLIFLNTTRYLLFCLLGIGPLILPLVWCLKETTIGQYVYCKTATQRFLWALTARYKYLTRRYWRHGGICHSNELERFWGNVARLARTWRVMCSFTDPWTSD